MKTEYNYFVHLPLLVFPYLSVSHRIFLPPLAAPPTPHFGLSRRESEALPLMTGDGLGWVMGWVGGWANRQRLFLSVKRFGQHRAPRARGSSSAEPPPFYGRGEREGEGLGGRIGWVGRLLRW